MSGLLILLFAGSLIIPAALLIIVNNISPWGGLLLINATGTALYLFIFNGPYLMLFFILASIIFIFGMFMINEKTDSERTFSLSRLKSGGIIFSLISGLLIYFAAKFTPPKQLPGEFAVDLAGGDPVQYLAGMFFEQYVIIIPLIALTFALLYTGAVHLVHTEED